MNESQSYTPKIWDICEFEDESLSPVPRIWIEHGQCFWPPYKTDAKINNAIAKFVAPEKNWAEFGIKRRLGHAETHDEALEKLELAYDETDVDQEFLRRKDKKTRNERHHKALDSDSSDGDQGEIKKNDLPKPPLRHVASYQQEKRTFAKDASSSAKHLEPHGEKFSTSRGGNKPSEATMRNGQLESRSRFELASSSGEVQHAQDEDISDQESRDTLDVQASNKTLSSGGPRITNDQRVKMKLTIVNNRERQSESSAAQMKKISTSTGGVSNRKNKAVAGLNSNARNSGKCDEIMENQAELSVSINNSSSPPSHDDFEGFDEYFAIKTPAEFVELNVNIRNKQYAHRVKRYLETFTVHDARKSTAAVLKALMDNEVAQLYNFTGQNGKEEFQILKIWIIIRGMLTAKRFKRKEIEDAAKDFFRYAKKRVNRAKNSAKNRKNRERTANGQAADDDASREPDDAD
ncbi:hypothetical protein QAD02_020561 [Eretmocerus hayati]|uniref:Uncharacterized protein n=1 Tax=Eretmocerus hayati TaxID=131215 RepID=A0ACC2PNS9_9HYME|nr:hypothetical protein QAD02_020561 [Eretmocerus hayati]